MKEVLTIEQDPHHLLLQERVKYFITALAWDFRDDILIEVLYK